MKKKVPLKTTSASFHSHVPAQLYLSSMERKWEHVIVRYYREPDKTGERLVPALPDPHIVIITSGSSVVEEQLADGSWSAVTVNKGDIFIIPPSEEPYKMKHRSISLEPLETLQIHIDKTLLAQMASQQLGIELSNIEWIERNAIKDPLLLQLGLNLKQELQHEHVGGHLMAALTARLIALHLIREHAVIREVDLQNVHQGLPAYRLRKVQEYINAHLAGRLAVEELAVVAGMSVFHFSRLFKRSTGLSPNQYIIQQRLEKAKSLLATTAMPVLEIALEVGYQNVSHFTQIFQKHLGMTPGKYRSAPH